MESIKTLEITDLPIFTTEVSNTEQESLFGGADYYIDKDTTIKTGVGLTTSATRIST